MDYSVNIFAQFTISSIIFILVMWLFYRHVSSRSKLPALKPLLFLFPVMIFREVTASVLFSIWELSKAATGDSPFFNEAIFFSTGTAPLLEKIFLVTDVLCIIILIFWLMQYTQRKAFVVPFILANLGALAILIANMFLNFLSNAPFLERLLPWLISLSDWIAFSILISSITEFNTPNSGHVREIRLRLTQIPVAYNILGIILMAVFNIGYDNSFIKAIFLPLGYLSYIYLFYKYIIIHEKEENQRIQFLEKDLNSLFEFMENLGSAIEEKLELPQILSFITSSVVKSTNADAGAILLVDEAENTLKVEAVNGVFPPPYPIPDVVKTKLASMQNYFKSMPIKIGDTILGEVAKTGQPIFIRNTTQDERMKQNVQNDILYVSSIIVLPLLVSKRIIGVISILRRDRTKLFTETDFDHVRTFANYSSLTIDFLMTYLELLEKREMERELGIAAEIQQKLLPRKLPDLKTASIGAFSIPAKGVSGDYYDILQFTGDRIGLVICDVAGKGVPAALIMVMIRSILHLITSAEKNAANVITWINRGITGKIDIDRFATMSFLTYDETTGEIVYSNAAHHPLLLFRAKTGTLENIDTEGLPIGIERAAKYGQKRFKMGKGDVAVLYTDGIIEAMNQTGEQYTFERFSRLIRDNATLTTDEIIAKIQSDLKAFVGPAPQHDDQTLMLMKVN